MFQKFVDTFVYELGKKEINLTKRAKIDALKLEPDEWERVKLFVNLLAVCPLIVIHIHANFT
jgi:hypothetical protein